MILIFINKVSRIIKGYGHHAKYHKKINESRLSKIMNRFTDRHIMGKTESILHDFCRLHGSQKPDVSKNMHLNMNIQNLENHEPI